MTELIYSKYSNERSRRFAIRTDILMDGEERFVEKKALYPEGKQHVKAIFRWYQELTRAYTEIPFSCNKCVETQDGIRLEYLEGQTLEVLLDSLLEKGRTEEAEKKLLEYLNQVKRVYSREPFAVTEAFREVFGNGELPQGLTCSAVTNIDMVCANLVLTNPPTVLDYEWSFAFPVPCEYVLYRIIHYYLDTHSVRKALCAEKFYKAFDITKERKSCFEEMEAHFQSYLTGSHIPMREMFADMTPGVGSVQVGKGGKLQIFFSMGAGYQEEHSKSFPMEEGVVSCTVEIPKGCDSIRIDPGDQACAVWVEELAFDGVSASLKDAVISNGLAVGKWVYIAQGDPNIAGIAVPLGAEALSLKIHTYAAMPELLVHIRELEEENRCLHTRVQRQAQLIHDMKNTRVWKLYQKYRNKVERKNQHG